MSTTQEAEAAWFLMFNHVKIMTKQAVVLEVKQQNLTTGKESLLSELGSVPDFLQWEHLVVHVNI